MRDTAEGVIDHHQETFIERVCDDLQRMIDRGTITVEQADQAIAKHGDDGLWTGWEEWKEDGE